MIQNIGSKCRKHQEQIITSKIEKYWLDQQYCYVCLSDMLKKQKCGQMHQILIDLVKNELRKIQSDFKLLNNNQSFERLNDNVLLIGPKKGGFKHGDYYYLFDDGTKQYAGLYDSNNKQGVWNDFVSFTYELEEYNNSPFILTIKTKIKRLNISIYDQGIKLFYQQKLGQNDIFVEKHGLFNQLEFQGKIIKNCKIGLWQILYKGDICGGGCFDEKGQKIGQWTEVLEKYNKKLKVQYQGEYKNGIRTGQWVTTYEGQKIGGGNYDEKGVKSGQWIDLHDNYWDSCQVIYQGEYKNGIRIGKWIDTYKGQEIGGGNYDEKGVKSGKWIDLHDNYSYSCQVIYQGEYKNGIRIGKWITTFGGLEIGGGNYDEKGVKSGKWIDLHDNYSYSCQVIYQGEYKNGIRIGKWITTYKGQKIGGGNYDEKGVKLGQWIDLHDNYCDRCLVTYKGGYKNGIRTGKWITTQKGQKIGGGNYDEKGVKLGQWIDLHDNYWDRCSVTYKGGYKNGIRTGKWITTQKGQEIGGGNYDEKGVKSGKWIDLHDNYSYRCQMTYQGEYKNGIRTGKWITTYNGQEIGGGNYDQKGVKSGQWIDLHDYYSYWCQVTYQGEYINGLRIGNWTEKEKNIIKPFGTYNEQGIKQ